MRITTCVSFQAHYRISINDSTGAKGPLSFRSAPLRCISFALAVPILATKPLLSGLTVFWAIARKADDARPVWIAWIKNIDGHFEQEKGLRAGKKWAHNVAIRLFGAGSLVQQERNGHTTSPLGFLGLVPQCK